MPRRGLRKKIKEYVLDRFQEDAPEAYFKFKSSSTQGLSRDETEFVKAIEVSAVQVVMSLLNCGLDPNFTISQCGETPLHLAVSCSKPVKDPVMEKVVGLLLYFGADPNALTSKGDCPLHAACARDNATIVEKLVDAGADVNQINDSQESPLMMLCGSAGQEASRILDLLLSSGADVTTVNTLGQNALHYVTHCQSCSLHRSRVTDGLLRSGLSVADEDEKGCCPLTYELELLSGGHSTLGRAEDRLAVVETLVKGGSSIPFQAVLDLHQSPNTRNLPERYDLLHQLVCGTHQVAPRQELRDLHTQLTCPPHSNVPKVKVICDDLESYLGQVLTLSHLCRVTVRSAMGSKVMSSAEQLPLPVSMREFLRSID